MNSRKMISLKKLMALALALVMVMTLFGCSSPVQPTEKPTEAPSYKVVDSGDLKVITTSKIDGLIQKSVFDEDLLNYIGGKVEGNYMISPLSFRYAAGLLLAGVSGETKTELMTALGIQNEEEWNTYCETFNGFVQWFADSLKADQDEYEEGIKEGWLNPDAQLPTRALRVANSVWTRSDIPALKESYKESIAKVYAAEYCSFTLDTAVKRINSWADEKTEHLIPELLPSDYNVSGLAVVLMNALYFKDSWVNPFLEVFTKDDVFYCKNGSTTTKTFMTQSDEFNYYKDGATELVTIPMASGVYMTFVIGDTANLSEKMAKAESRQGQVTIPKLDLETSLSGGELIDFLKDRGVTKLFTTQADFSNMIDYDLTVSDIIQKTRIKLDEEGVEAAAVTAIMCKDASCPEPTEPFVFRADRSFHFYIHTTLNDAMTALLFAGEIVE